MTNQSKNKNRMYNFKISEEGKKQRKLNSQNREKKKLLKNNVNIKYLIVVICSSILIITVNVKC